MRHRLASGRGSAGRAWRSKGSSRVKRKFHARFLGGRGRVNRLRLPGAPWSCDCVGNDFLTYFAGEGQGDRSAFGEG
jgi:hypothetical protein